MYMSFATAQIALTFYKTLLLFPFPQLFQSYQFYALLPPPLWRSRPRNQNGTSRLDFFSVRFAFSAFFATSPLSLFLFSLPFLYFAFALFCLFGSRSSGLLALSASRQGISRVKGRARPAQGIKQKRAVFFLKTWIDLAARQKRPIKRAKGA